MTDTGITEPKINGLDMGAYFERISERKCSDEALSVLEECVGVYAIKGEPIKEKWVEFLWAGFDGVGRVVLQTLIDEGHLEMRTCPKQYRITPRGEGLLAHLRGGV